MKELSIRDMRAHLGDLDLLLQQAGEILVTRHGVPIARITAVKDQLKRPSHKALRSLTDELTITSEQLIRQDRDER